MIGDFPTNAILGDVHLISRAVYAEYSNTPNAEKEAWCENNLGRWRRVNATAAEPAPITTPTHTEQPKAVASPTADFLKQWPSYPVLTAIHTDPETGEKGRIESKAFPPNNGEVPWAIVEKWIADRDGKANLYFQVNPRVTGADEKIKAKLTDIAALVALHVDIDVRVGEAQDAGIARIIKTFQGCKLLPTCIIASGGGAQAFWLLDAPIEINGDAVKAEAAKLYNVQIERDLGGDHCHNIDRIMRLPGTLNIPNAVKLKKGRKPARAVVVEMHPERRYSIDEFKMAPSDKPAADNAVIPKSAAPVGQPITLESLKMAGVSQDVLDLIMNGPSTGNDWKVACEIYRCGFHTLESLEAAYKLGKISADAAQWPRGGFHAEMARLFERVRVQAVNPDFERLNSKHCIISDMGGKCVVLNESLNPKSGDHQVTFSSFEAFANRYGNKRTAIGKNDEGSIKYGPLASAWLHSKERRQYDHIVFAPGRDVVGAYNLFHGFSVEPDFDKSARKCWLYLRHIFENICQGDGRLFKYTIRWMANAVQNPGMPAGVALVWRGKMGIGKGEGARHFGELFGPHFIPVTKAEHIVGKFNGHMGKCIVLFGDECFHIGDDREEQVLKVLVTERRWLIEFKGYDAQRFDSCLHIILACNQEWSVPVHLDDRRFCCVEAGDKHMRDHDYFKALDHQMRNGGKAALLGFLLKVDLTNFNAEAFPHNAEHDRQRANTRKGVDAMVEEWCHEGRLPFSHANNPNVIITSGEARGWGFDHAIRASGRGQSPGKIKNDLRLKWGTEHFHSTIAGKFCTGIRLPALADLRAMFEAIHNGGRPMDWRSDATKWEASNDDLPF